MSGDARLQVASSEYQKLQVDLSNAVDARQRLAAQLTETETVKDVFTKLKDENTVFKLIGTVLVKQEQGEAKANVDKRLEFIQSEIKRVEAQLEDIDRKSEKKKAEIVELQNGLQQNLQQKTAATVKAANAKAL